MDGDGDPDVVAGGQSNEVIWYENDGSGNGWGLHRVTINAITISALASADIDLDGDLDLISGSTNDNLVNW